MILGFVGNRGQGKTLSLIRRVALKYNADKDIKIFSNIMLRGIPFQEYTIDDLLRYTNERVGFEKAIFIIDEAHITIDSRTSALKKNRILSYLFLQSRKKNFDVYYTTQFLHQIDKRLRATTDVIIMCSTKRKNKKQYTLNKCVYLDSAGRHKIINIVFESDKFYKYYDTNEVVKIIEDDKYAV